MNNITLNLWDDYFDDSTGKPQNTHLYVEESSLSSAVKQQIVNQVYDWLDRYVPGQFNFFLEEGDNPKIHLENLTHKRRVPLVEELNAAKLKHNSIPLRFITES